MTSNDSHPSGSSPSIVKPPVPPEGSSEQRSFGSKIILAALVIFAVSLALPVLEFNLFSKSVFHGIHAALLVFPAALENPISLMPIFALGNVWLLLLPIVARSRKSSTVGVAALVTWGVALSALSLRLQEQGDDLMVGYYVWVIGFFVAAIGATWVAFDRPEEDPWKAVS